MNVEVFREAKKRAEKLAVRNILVATNSGRSVEAARNVLGPSFNYFAVGNPSTSREKGWVLHEGITPETKARLETEGITVIEQDVSIFQCQPDRYGDQASFRNANAAYVSRFAGTFAGNEAVPNNICKVMRHLIGEFFGDGLCVCIEITVMAADSGQLPLDEDCMAIATPAGYSHSALVLHPVHSAELFSTHFRIKDLLLVPSDNDIWFNEGPIP